MKNQLNKHITFAFSLFVVIFILVLSTGNEDYLLTFIITYGSTYLAVVSAVSIANTQLQFNLTSQEQEEIERSIYKQIDLLLTIRDKFPVVDTKSLRSESSETITIEKLIERKNETENSKKYDIFEAFLIDLKDENKNQKIKKSKKLQIGFIKNNTYIIYIVYNFKLKVKEILDVQLDGEPTPEDIECYQMKKATENYYLDHNSVRAESIYDLFQYKSQPYRSDSEEYQTKLTSLKKVDLLISNLFIEMNMIKKSEIPEEIKKESCTKILRYYNRYLGSYFQMLLQLITYINNNVTEIEKRNRYIRLLRATFSESEILVVYYFTFFTENGMDLKKEISNNYFFGEKIYQENGIEFTYFSKKELIWDKDLKKLEALTLDIIES